MGTTERMTIPGVFTRENDETFLEQGIGEIGAAFIGPFQKGPAFVPVDVTSRTELEQRFGSTYEKYFTPYTVDYYLKNAASAKVVRVLWDEGYTKVANEILGVVITGSSANVNVAAILAPTHANTTMSLDVANSTAQDLRITITSGSTWAYTGSLYSTDSNYLTNLFGTDPRGNSQAYVQLIFDDFISGSTPTQAATSSSMTMDFSWATGNNYKTAETPYVISQNIGNVNTNLFKFISLNDGTCGNKDIKVAIYNVKKAGTIAGSDYGQFSVAIRKYDDVDKRPTVYETFTNLTLDPNATNYLPRMIGDRYGQWDTTNKTMQYYGDYANKSNYIRVEMASSGIAPNLIPFGFAALKQPLAATENFPTASLKTDQLYLNETNTRVYYGLDFTKTDALNYLNPVPEDATTGSNAAFKLENIIYSGSARINPSSSTTYTKFVVPFQQGFDGADPTQPLDVATTILSSTNTQGFDCSSATADGTTVYKRAIDVLSNPYDVDINQLYIPGITINDHSSVYNYAEQTVEDRTDTFYVADLAGKTTTVANAKSYVETIDSSYTATYFPWVKIKDKNNNKYVWVPPSTVMASAIAYNDRYGYQWFAPAGLNRASLPMVVEAEFRLSSENIQDLYDNRINPLKTMNGEVVAWGQKTLQAKPSALDRISVRRLLLNLKKYVSSVSQYLVFEKNNTVTRERFINRVTPYMNDVRSKQGLYTFKIVMDDTNNTAEVIDRNELVGQVWIEPAKDAETIIIDFNITPTGGTFAQ